MWKSFVLCAVKWAFLPPERAPARQTAQKSKRSPAKCSTYWRPTPFSKWRRQHSLRQQFQQLQQKVQDLLNRSSYDERMLFVNQLTQLSPWFKQPSTRRSNRQQPQLPKLQWTPPLVLRRLLKLLPMTDTRRVRAMFLLRSKLRNPKFYCCWWRRLEWYFLCIPADFGFSTRTPTQACEGNPLGCVYGTFQIVTEEL